MRFKNKEYMLDITGIKKIILIIGSLIIVSIIVIFVVTIRATKEPQEQIVLDDTGEDSTMNDLQTNKKVSIPEYTPQPITEEERKEREMERFVAVFIERFGTFSNQNELSNLEALKTATTPSFYQWARRYGLGIAGESDSSVYYGITTQSLNVVIDFSKQENPDIKRVYTATTQRAEVRGFEGNAKLFAQEADVELTKEGDQWLVSGVFWEKGDTEG